MNWINAFELLCYGITAMLLWDILRRKQWEELRLFLSAALAGFILELLAVRVTGIYHYSPDFYISNRVPAARITLRAPYQGTVCGISRVQSAARQ